MNCITRKVIASTLFICSLGSMAHAAPITRFTVVDSAQNSWVARGLQDYTVSADLGWRFDVSRNFDNGVSFRISTPTRPSSGIDLWFLDFSAPFDEVLQPGIYNDFQRYPFQDSDRPGLAFGSSGRLDNMASGIFEILAATYSTTGEVLSFAADFTHYGEQQTDRYAIAELRYNYTAVPTPTSLSLLLLGMALVGSRSTKWLKLTSW